MTSLRKIRAPSQLFTWMSLLFAMFLVGLLLAASAPALAQTAEVTILHISDTHSHLAPWGPKRMSVPTNDDVYAALPQEVQRSLGVHPLDGTLGGLSKAARVITLEKLKNPHALLVHSGDFMDGDLFFNEYLGSAELRLLKSIGLDALVLGNHDFRFGPDFLVSVLNSAWPSSPVPILGTNLDTSASSLAPWTVSTMIKEVNGVKIGLFGLTPPDGALASPAPVQILPYLSVIAPEAVSQLRAAGAQVVVCVAHIGMAASTDLASKVPGIDVILNGHDHAALNAPVVIPYTGGETLIVSAGSGYRWVGRLRLKVSGSTVTLANYSLISVDGSVPAWLPMRAQIKELQSGIVARYGDVYHDVLALSDSELSATWDPNSSRRDTPVGNLFADAYRAATGTDIAIEALGFLDDPLPKGPVVGADIFRSMSYGSPAVVSGDQIVSPWPLVKFNTYGAVLLSVFNSTITLGGAYFPQVSGVRMDYNSASTGNKLLFDSVYIGDTKIVGGQIYSVTVNAGVYSALKSLGAPMLNVQMLSTTAFDAARSYVAAQKQLTGSGPVRIRDLAVSDTN